VAAEGQEEKNAAIRGGDRGLKGHGDGVRDGVLGTDDIVQRKEGVYHVAMTSGQPAHILQISNNIRYCTIRDHHACGSLPWGRRIVHLVHDRADHMVESEDGGFDDNSSAGEADIDYSELVKRDREDDGDELAEEQMDGPLLADNCFGDDEREVTREAFCTAMVGMESDDDCHTAVQNYIEALERVHGGGGGDDFPNLPRECLMILSGQMRSLNEAELSKKELPYSSNSLMICTWRRREISQQATLYQLAYYCHNCHCCSRCF